MQLGFESRQKQKRGKEYITCALQSGFFISCVRLATLTADLQQQTSGTTSQGPHLRTGFIREEGSEIDLQICELVVNVERLHVFSAL